MTGTDPHANAPVLTAGAEPKAAKAAMILLHGRGATARDILGLAGAIGRPDIAYVAPQATGNTWYPHRFLVPRAENQPHLDSAHAVVARLLAMLEGQGVPAEKVILAGFSQGACLASDHAARNPRRYGGVIAFSGGLIGDRIDAADFAGSLDGTPAFVGCSDVDGHIPAERVRKTAEVLGALGAEVTLRLYPGMGHTINQDEIAAAQAMVDAVVAG
ncbi:MAG: dienelactone hydrolase family protein [Bauldia sp.]|nr:dienelactone hydrolase family protein [Bauldia sp.]